MSSSARCIRGLQRSGGGSTELKVGHNVRIGDDGDVIGSAKAPGSLSRKI